jgi:hypothetical protein
MKCCGLVGHKRRMISFQMWALIVEVCHGRSALHHILTSAQLIATRLKELKPSFCQKRKKEEIMLEILFKISLLCCDVMCCNVLVLCGVVLWCCAVVLRCGAVLWCCGVVL